jgi:DNA-binding NarL/FixJ family response regulator
MPNELCGNEDTLRGLQAGACGYLLKDTSRETLLDAIISSRWRDVSGFIHTP